MKQKPLVSIIIPVFKVEQFLDICVLSVIKQTYQELEIILVDDGSPDCCGEMCDKLASKDHRIHVIHQDNMGLAKARRSGFINSTGDYIYFLDSDDFIEPDAISNLVERTGDGMVDMVVSGIIIDGEKKYKRLQIIKPGYYNREAIDNLLKNDFLFNESHYCSAFPLYAWGKLIKREVMDGYFEVSTQFMYWEDIAATVFLSKKICSMVITDDCSYHYVVHCGQVTKKPIKDIWHYYADVWNYLHKNDKEHYFDRQLPKRIWAFCCAKLRAIALQKSYKEFAETYDVIRQPDVVKQLVLDKDSIIQGTSNNMYKFFMRNGWRIIHFLFLRFWVIERVNKIKRIIKFNK